jgi:putative inorganic carbon (HCO3(-)) transporter
VAAALLAIALGISTVIPPVLIGAALMAAILLLVYGGPHERVFLGALILAVPFSRYARIEIGHSALTAADVLVALVAARWLMRGISGRSLTVHVGPSVIAAFLFLLAAWLSMLFAEEFASSLAELVKLAEMIVVAVYGTSAFREQGNATFVMKTIVLTAAIESVVAILQTLTSNGPAGFALGDYVRAYGDFDQPNVLGGYLAIALPFAVALVVGPFTHKPLTIACMGLILLALGATLSRGAWLGTLIALAVMASLWSARTRRAVLVSLAAFAVLAIGAMVGLAPKAIADRLSVLTENFVVFDARTVDVTPNNFSLVERMAHWQAGWAMGLDNPITGVGPGNFEASYDRYFLPGWPVALGHAHNIYINTFAEEGAIGLAAFLLFLIVLFVRVGRTLRRIPRENAARRALLLACLGAITAFSVHNMFDNMFVHGIGIQVGLILGLVEAAALEHGRAEVLVADRD